MKSPHPRPRNVLPSIEPTTIFAWSPRPGAKTLTLSEQVAEKIGSAIIQGHLVPGQRIQEQDVADSIGVSRGPVREALRILERDGFVQINARRGAQVTQLTPRGINDVFTMRIALLGLTARLLAEQDDRAVIEGIRAKVDRLPDLAIRGSVDTYLNAIYELNWLLADATGNHFLRNTLFSLVYLSLRYGRLGLVTEKSRVKSAKCWRTLLDLIERRRAKEAQQLAEEFFAGSRDRALSALREASQ